MTRLVARLILAMLILPCTGVVFVIAGMLNIAFAALTGRPSVVGALGLWLVTYAFIAFYWVTLWRSLVRWTPARVWLTIGAGFGSVLVGLFFAAAMLMTPMAAEPVPIIVISGGPAPIVWVLLTVFIWRETPSERAARLASIGPGGVVCPVCSYNLTGLHSSDCPECGARFTVDGLLAAQRERVTLADD